jgi:hypothetical protein
LFDSSLFLKQAKEWVKKRDQASLRSAASRAYYSLYNSTLEYLKTNHKNDLINGIKRENFNSNNPKTIHPDPLKALDMKYLGKIVPMHKVVADVCFSIGGKQFSSQLRTQHEFRKIADYDMNEILHYDDVYRNIGNIEGLFRQLRQSMLR